MSDTTLYSDFAYPAPADEAKWSPRQSLLFMVGSSCGLWSLIGLAIWAVL